MKLYRVKKDCTFRPLKDGKSLFYGRDCMVKLPDDIVPCKHFELVSVQTAETPVDSSSEPTKKAIMAELDKLKFSYSKRDSLKELQELLKIARDTVA